MGITHDSTRPEIALIAVADKRTKAAKTTAQEKAIFKLFSFGLVTNRDEWIYDRDKQSVQTKIDFLVKQYEQDRNNKHSKRKIPQPLSQIKWTRSVKSKLDKNQKIETSGYKTVTTLYRPFDKQLLLFMPELIEMLNLTRAFFGVDGSAGNLFLAFTDPTSQKPFMAMSGDVPFDMHLVGAASGAAGLPLHRYLPDGSRVDNITDWGLKQFEKAYGKTKPRPITKDAIFHYVYGVLHDPVYRETYAQNLKREFPRIPFYPDFWRWAEWGEKLMALHIGFETVEPWPVVRSDLPDARARAAGIAPKPILKSLPEVGSIRLDSETTLSGIPKLAFEYRLGNRSGLDWILDQYKEKTPKDPTIRERFNTYRFADYKDKVIDLIARVTRVSVETVGITEAMRAVPREP